jgi:hypothetical protein
MTDQTTGLTYAQAGVDIDAGNALVDAIKPLAKVTRRPGAEASLGGFGALFDLQAAGCADPGSPKMLSIHSKVLCQHGGSVSIVPVGPRGTTPSGQPAARPSDRFVISGCANPRETCVRVQWLIASDPLNNSNEEMCVTASGVPAGQLIIINADHFSPVRAGGF